MTRSYPGALYRTKIRHVRESPLHNEFTYRSVWWLVNVDRLPVLPIWLRPFARFTARDHFDGRQPTIRAGADSFLAEHDIDLGGGEVWMLTNARVLGVNFNPLSVFWCFGADGRLRAVIAEVHNTYGERHCYLLDAAAAAPGGTVTDKVFRVSPFNGIDGQYRIRLPFPRETLTASVELHRTGEAAFSASVFGVRDDITARSVLRIQRELPVSPLRVILQIRWQGIGLWLRGLSIARTDRTDRTDRWPARAQCPQKG